MNIDIKNYNNTEVSIHRISQFIALTGINLLEKKRDDSHTNMSWIQESNSIAGRYFTLGSQRQRLVFNPKARNIAFQDEQKNLSSVLHIDKRTQEDIKDWWAECLHSFGFEGELNWKLHYQLPDSRLYNSKEIPEPDTRSLSHWIRVRTQANDALAALNKISGISSDIRIWPHHFDTGVYYPLKHEHGKEVHSIGAGLAIADSMVPEPYYYIYGWKKEEEIDYTIAPKLERGKWYTDKWKGAVLPVRQSDSGIIDFFGQAFEFLKR